MSSRFSILARSVFVAFTFILLPGCELFEKKTEPPVPHGNGSGYDGIVYLQVRPGYRCQKDGVPISSPVSRIIVKDDSFTQWSDDCSNQVLREGTTAELEISEDRELIGYKEATYQRLILSREANAGGKP